MTASPPAPSRIQNPVSSGTRRARCDAGRAGNDRPVGGSMCARVVSAATTASVHGASRASRPVPFLLLAALVFLARIIAAGAAPSPGFLEIRDGYFFDSGTQEYFVPRGIAYQSWNPPVGANQSFEQLDYDLLEFKKMHANSVRCEFVWGEVQTGPDEWNWDKPEHLVEQAEKLGLRLFVIIGFQYPPAWFPPEWRSIHDQGLTPDVLECIRTNTPGQIPDCLPQPLYNNLTTNQWSAELLPTILGCLTSSVPSEVVSALKTRIPEQHPGISTQDLQGVLRCFISDVVNFEHPEARRAYTNHIAKVAAKYKDRAVIGAWIMGNECAYFDLWESPEIFKVRRSIGYDPHSIAAFRAYLQTAYSQDIAALNTRWRTTYAGFDSVEMPRFFPADRSNPAFHDLIQWRQRSIGDFIASGAIAARREDPNHLLTYSMVGGIFNGNDANNTCEDAKAIVASCLERDAPLAFWSINNYAWAAYGSELRTGDFGIAKYQEELGLPVMISETGHSSTETIFEGAQPRQAKALPGQVWESLISGAIGTHIFHWNDRDQFTQGYFDREKGFGIVHQNRKIKDPVYPNTVAMFRRMQDIGIDRLLGGSSNPPSDVLFFWSKTGEIGWPRANQENAMLWGVLKRLGYQPGIIDDAKFDRRLFTNAPVLLLSRAWQLDPAHLARIETDVLASGIHVHANADLPGQFDAYLRPNPEWAGRIRSIFGLDVANAAAVYHSGATNDQTSALVLDGASPLGGITANWHERILTWRIWHDIQPAFGTTVVRHTGYNQTRAAAPEPALQVAVHPHARSAINTFAIGDTYEVPGDPPQRLWSTRYDLLRAIYRDHFGVVPAIDISGPGAKRVISDYRVCSNGSLFLSFLNEDTVRANIVVSAPALLAGRTVENLTTGGTLVRQSNGTFSLSLGDDEYVLLYAYHPAPAPDTSLINPHPAKLWFDDAPLLVWPRLAGFPVRIGFDIPNASLELSVALEQIHPVLRPRALTSAVTVAGRGEQTVHILIPDFDLNDPHGLSSARGGEYRFTATLSLGGLPVSTATLPVRLTWAVQPLSLPAPPLEPGRDYSIPVRWEELPSFEPGDVMPLDRARLWESLQSKSQFYNIILELRDASGGVLAAQTNAVSVGSGETVFNVRAPAAIPDEPPAWNVTLQSAPDTGTFDVTDGFEGRDLGLNRAPFHPWFSYHDADFHNTVRRSQGVRNVLRGTNPANRAACVEIANPADPGAFSVFGLVIGVEAVFRQAALHDPGLAVFPVPREIGLPIDRNAWTNYTFGFDFREPGRRPCALQLQVKDVHGNWIEFSQPYSPGPDGWNRIEAHLGQFTTNPNFDSTRVKDFVVNVVMLQTNAVYLGAFDNISITGPTRLHDTFEDRAVLEDYSRIAPWQAYGYDGLNHNDVLLDHGVHLLGSEGSQSVFLIGGYRPDGGNFAGIGLSYTFPEPWALPANRADWSQFSFGFDFMERDRLPCVLEIQLKNRNETNAFGGIIQRGIHLTKPYTPGTNGWDTLFATLDQFVQHPAFAPFDPNAVDSLVVNVAMLEKDPNETVIYVASIDNIRFNAPEIIRPGAETWSYYTSANDFFGFHSVLPEPDGSVLLEWSGGGILESADALDGTWTDIPEAASPFRAPPRDIPQQFFRLRR